MLLQTRGEKMSDESEFDCGEDVLEEEDLCDYNGEQCIGDKLFCAECPVLTGYWSEEKKNPLNLEVWVPFWKRVEAQSLVELMLR
jgi:hypothetical protein